MFITKKGHELFFRLTILISLIMPVSLKVFSLPVEIPVKVQEAFKRQFPAASNVKWQRSENEFIANFKDKKTFMRIIFDGVGTILESEKEIEVSEIPERVVMYIMTQDETSKIISAHRIEKNNNTVVLYDVVAKAQFKKSTFTITKDGYLTSRR